MLSGANHNMYTRKPDESLKQELSQLLQQEEIIEAGREIAANKRKLKIEFVLPPNPIRDN